MTTCAVLFFASGLISLLTGLFAEDPDGVAVPLHRALLVLTVMFGFGVSWGY